LKRRFLHVHFWYLFEKWMMRSVKVRRTSRRLRGLFTRERRHKVAYTRATRGRAPRDQTGFFVYSSRDLSSLWGFHAQRCLRDGTNERCTHLSTRCPKKNLLDSTTSEFDFLLHRMVFPKIDSDISWISRIPELYTAIK